VIFFSPADKPKLFRLFELDLLSTLSQVFLFTVPGQKGSFARAESGAGLGPTCGLRLLLNKPKTQAPPGLGSGRGHRA
jgi:hypothetical protein